MRKRTKTPIFLTFLVISLGLSLVIASLLFAEHPADSADTPSPLAFENIAFGSESAYACRIPTLLVIRDQEDWERVWNLHHGREASKHQLPDVDFKLYSVIALFSGRSAVVEALQITRVEGREDAMTVSAVEVEPGLDCSGPKVIKNAFHIVRVPVLKKHITPSLEIEILSRQCGR